MPQDALVIRENEEKMIPVENIVVGDIIKIKSGSKVPADARLLVYIKKNWIK